MKSEERHQLQTNDLEKFTKDLGKFFEQHGKKIFIALVAVVLVVILIVVALNWGKAAANESWKDLYNAGGTAESFQNIADNVDNKGSKISAIAYLGAGKLNFITGFRLYFTDRDGGLSDLKKAQENFESALDSKAAPDWVREQALYGLATCAETMSDGDTSKAIAAYEQLIKEYPQSIYIKIAKTQIEELKKDHYKNFYAFLSSNDRKPDDIPKPFDLQNLPPGQNPFNNFPVEERIDLPLLPDALMESAPFIGLPGNGKAKKSPFENSDLPPLDAPRPKAKKPVKNPNVKPTKK